MSPTTTSRSSRSRTSRSGTSTSHAPAAASGVTLEQALTDLPVKLRVHELAKRAGIASKDVISALAGAGVTVSSAASSVSAADATDLLTALLGAPAAPIEAVFDADPGLAATASDPLPEPDPGFFAAPLFLPPVEAKPTRRRRGTKPPVESAPPSVDTEPVAPVAAAAAEPSTAGAVEAAVEGDAAEPTASRSGRRRRGRSTARGRGEPTETLADGSSATAGDAGPDVTSLDSSTPDGPRPPGAADAAEVGEHRADDGADRDDAVDDDDTDQAAGRRRRRGRRGRGRAGDDRPTDQAESGDLTAHGVDGAPGTDPASSTADVNDAEAATGAADSEAEQDESEDSDEGGTRRRRRRRRRTGSPEPVNEGTGPEDDPDNTVVHVRESRSGGGGGSSGGGPTAGSSSASEVQGVRGSTRLEAKRQRRRDTRDTRRRPQILTEAEFLARREAVDRVMAVRQRGDLAQVALLEDGVLVEHFVSRAGSESLMGNIYLGKVQNVLPSMEAAFIDIGKGRNAVLYAGEVNWDAAGLAGKARRIETALSGGDTLLVQVSKDPVGQKGARLTTQISLPGRFLVYVPGGGATGISRKLPDTERRRLKSILDRIVPEDAGVIIRTAAEGVAEEELARDVDRLKSQWEEISRQAAKKSNAPLLLSAEPDTLIKVVRDLFNSDISRLVLDGERAYEPVAAYINAVAPELAERVSRYDGPNDVFTAYRIDEQIAKALERKVYLPSGGSLVIDRTEAMTVVDVNTGKYTGSGGNLEETVTKNNLEAAEEVVRQLRLRDIGGIIVVDFIDMVLEANRELVMRRLTECLGRDRTRHQVAEVTSLGLIQMTRKKMGTGLVEAFSEPCPHCQGRGIILHDVPMDDRSGSDLGETDGRSARGRRGRGRAETPAPEPEPMVKIVPATVRPPDPRGPKPPLRTSGEEHQAGRDADPDQAAPDQLQPGQLPAVPDAPVGDSSESAPAEGSESLVGQRGGRSAAGNGASLNAPRSRDAAEAVSAVLAALDAQTERRGQLDLAAPAADEAGSNAARSISGASAAAESNPTGGRRRGRRAAGRPAGAPSIASALPPVSDPAGARPSEGVLAVPAAVMATVGDPATPERAVSEGALALAQATPEAPAVETSGAESSAVESSGAESSGAESSGVELSGVESPAVTSPGAEPAAVDTSAFESSPDDAASVASSQIVPVDGADGDGPGDTAEPVSRGRAAARRRGSRAAGAARSSATPTAPGESASPPAADPGSGSGPNGAHPAGESPAGGPADAPSVGPETVAGQVTTATAAPPRRRRAASRPAGPAAAPERQPQH